MILFPLDTLERGQVERDYRTEFDAARAAVFDTALFDFDALRRGDSMNSVLRRVPDTDSPSSLLYRGWMLNASAYARLFNALEERGWNLINDAAMYRFAHHAPENYEFWRRWMPQTAWIEREHFEQSDGVHFAPIFETLRGFGSSPVIVKDWVKSQKHRWNEACFIPDASDEDVVRRVVSRFLELQGEYFTGGLIFRRFEQLRRDANGQSFEWRSFWLNGELLSVSPNPHGTEAPPTQQFAEAARRCLSRFFTIDFAQRENGEWLIIEMGDGGVSGLPPSQDFEQWYLDLAKQLIS